MKLFKKSVLLIVPIIIAFALVSCGCKNDKHKWSQWKDSTATCTKIGTEMRICEKRGCNAEETRDAAPLGHNFDNGICTRCEELHNPGLSFISNGDGTCQVDYQDAIDEPEIIIIPSISPSGDIVTSISEGAFVFSSFSKIVLPDTITEIKKSAFERGGGGELVIPSSVKTIGDSAFFDTLFSNIIFSEGLESIGNSAFSTTCIKNLTLPDSLKSIGEYAFAYSDIESVFLGKSVEKIGDAAFAYCTNLKNITVSEENNHFKSPDGNLYSKNGKRLLQYAIKKPEGEYTILDGVVEISPRAFQLCWTLTKVNLPESVENIGDGAFAECHYLTDISIGNSIKVIGNNVFDLTPIGTISLPDTLVSIGSSTFGIQTIYYEGAYEDWEDVAKPDDCDYTVNFGRIYSKGLEFTSYGDGTCYVSGVGACMDSNIFIPKKSPDGDIVIAIGENAFAGRKVIVDCTDENCDISGCTEEKVIPLNYVKNIWLPNTVTDIGAVAFFNMTALEKIDLPESIVFIDATAFDGCEAFCEIYYRGTSKMWSAIVADCAAELFDGIDVYFNQS